MINKDNHINRNIKIINQKKNKGKKLGSKINKARKINAKNKLLCNLKIVDHHFIISILINFIMGKIKV
jgi:hypothetical protein